MGHCPTLQALVSREGTDLEVCSAVSSDRLPLCLIRRGAVALGKRALTTGVQIASDVVAGQNVKKAAKRRATDAGRDLMESLLNTPPPPGKRVKRIKRAAPRRRVISNKRRSRSDVFS